MPAARTATSRSSGPGTGSGCSRHSTAPPTTVAANTGCRPALGAGRDGDVVALVVARVALPGLHDLLVHLQRLDAVGQPAGRAGDGEEHCEHLDGETHGLVDQARVEVDVGVELAVDEVGVGQGDLLQLQGDV